MPFQPDGMKLFGLIELDVEYAGVRFAVGLRNANDKSMRVGSGCRLQSNGL